MNLYLSFHQQEHSHSPVCFVRFRLDYFSSTHYPLGCFMTPDSVGFLPIATIIQYLKGKIKWKHKKNQM